MLSSFRYPRADLPAALSLYGYGYVGRSLDSYVVEPSWSARLFHLLGGVYLEEGLPFSSFKASIPGSQDNLSLLMFGFDTRLKHSWEWFPLRAVVPFIEGGYRVSFLSQSGPSDFESGRDCRQLRCGCRNRFVGERLFRLKPRQRESLRRFADFRERESESGFLEWQLRYRFGVDEF